jgi:hypothetical protein
MAEAYRPAPTREKTDAESSATATESVETVGGFAVHPAASLFPLLEGERFDELVASIRDHGIRQPIVTHEGTLIDGRNRARAVARLADEGVAVELPTVALTLADGQSVAEWVFDTNVVRRHLTDDARALVVAKLVPMMKAGNAARQEASRFTKGTSGNPAGQATTKTSSPAPRDRRAADARSTVGQVSARSGVSMHKARQAVAVADGVESGTVRQADVDAVIAGQKKLREVAPKRRPRRESPTAKARREMQERKAAEKRQTQEARMTTAADADRTVADFNVRWPKAWERFKEHFAVADYAQLRKLVIDAVRAEMKAHQ